MFSPTVPGRTISYWQKTDKKILRRINGLVREIMRTPFEGTAKPEPLKHALSGYWSRRINDEHRIVYKVTEDAVHIAQLRYHYLKGDDYPNNCLMVHLYSSSFPSSSSIPMPGLSGGIRYPSSHSKGSLTNTSKKCLDL